MNSPFDWSLWWGFPSGNMQMVMTFLDFYVQSLGSGGVHTCHCAPHTCSGQRPTYSIGPFLPTGLGQGLLFTALWNLAQTFSCPHLLSHHRCAGITGPTSRLYMGSRDLHFCMARPLCTEPSPQTMMIFLKIFLKTSFSFFQSAQLNPKLFTS